MNKPDDKTLKSWLEGELEGEELQNLEAWAQTHVGELDDEFKCEIGWSALNDEILARISGSEEPPYPEFFNSKIQQAISGDFRSNHVADAASSSLWQKLCLIFVPAAIAAAVAFYAGIQIQNQQPASAPKVASVKNSIYVPNDGVEAMVSDSSEATEIVLSGLVPISDDLDIAAGETSPGRSPMMAKTQEELSHFSFY